MFLLVSCGTEIGNNFCPGVMCGNDNGSSSNGSSPTVVYATLFSDDFNRGNEVPIAFPWFSARGEDVTLVSNELQPIELNATDPPSILHDTNAVATNVRVSASFRIGGAGYGGEMMIYIRSQSNLSVNNSYFCGINPGTLQLAIAKFNGGAASPLSNSTATITYDNGDSYVLTFTAEGAELSCSISGSDTLSTSVTDSDFTWGYSGIGGGENGNNVLFVDDFLVETGS